MAAIGVVVWLDRTERRCILWRYKREFAGVLLDYQRHTLSVALALSDSLRFSGGLLPREPEAGLFLERYMEVPSERAAALDWWRDVSSFGLWVCQ
jgi:hypothetical protein